MMDKIMSLSSAAQQLIDSIYYDNNLTTSQKFEKFGKIEYFIIIEYNNHRTPVKPTSLMTIDDIWLV